PRRAVIVFFRRAESRTSTGRAGVDSRAAACWALRCVAVGWALFMTGHVSCPMVRENLRGAQPLRLLGVHDRPVGFRDRPAGYTRWACAVSRFAHAPAPAWLQFCAGTAHGRQGAAQAWMGPRRGELSHRGGIMAHATAEKTRPQGLHTAVSTARRSPPARMVLRRGTAVLPVPALVDPDQVLQVMLQARAAMAAEDLAATLGYCGFTTMEATSIAEELTRAGVLVATEEQAIPLLRFGKPSLALADALFTRGVK